MTVHILDTGAVYELLNIHNPKLRRDLKNIPDTDGILIPAPVLVEVGQSYRAR